MAAPRRRGQQQRGVWTRTKLRLLATALGYPHDLLVDCIPPDMFKKQRMNSEDLRRSLDSGHFTTALNITWNMKNDEYNVAVIKKCVQFLDSGIISFNELRIIRLMFFTFEQPYKNGMIIDKDILMEVLKMCSRVVAPEKLMHRIKHWKSTYTVKDRIQFYEFMDLLLLTESVDKVFIKEEEVQATEETSSDLLQLEDVNSLGESHYEKLTKYLSKQFHQEERNYGTITIDSKRLTKQPLLVEKRKQAAQLQRNMYGWLKTTLKESHEQVKQGKGRHLILPLPPLEDCHKITRSSKQRSSSAKSGKHWQQEKGMDDWVWVVSIPPLKCGSYTAHSLPPILSTEELEELQKKKKELKFQMNTVKERAELELKWKIDYYLPGHRELSASRQDAVGLLMKTTAEMRPKESEMASIPIKRNYFVSQASKCQPGNSEKPPHASRFKDAKCPLKTQETKKHPILCALNAKGEEKTVDCQRTPVYSRKRESVSCPPVN
ncbi:uncharacterized protein LOC129698886 isoform X2 [Leucoraja erinacea]|uniref:uncharacterized protein LOC129698886 isoform X2 n=1 Tax=Leucoraja erinaceus TaxID=7782 RepID=UPI00245570D4|nr:uncharacterized protein LOC129698886 isoform X2 [Leucoraja erinacea]